MVDIAYFGFDDGTVDLTALPLAERRALLEAPGWPFDGMNEAGVAVGMAAVPTADERSDRGKPAIGSLGVMREVLDHAGSVDEAVAILSSYNIDWEGGPPLHYLVADRTGRAALVEFHGGRIAVLPNAGPWHAATNFTISAVAGHLPGSVTATTPSSSGWRPRAASSPPRMPWTSSRPWRRRNPQRSGRWSMG